jgi:hypothetical protein
MNINESEDILNRAKNDVQEYGSDERRNLRMMNKEAIELAKKIVELDIKRDMIWEQLASLAGKEAYELLRYVQNS